MRSGRVLNLLLIAALLLAAVATPGVSAAAVTSDPSAALSKIEPLVLEEIAAEGQTEYFVWMAEKADLSPADQLATKQERGRFVFNALVETAERTQADLRGYLDAQGVEYQAFYIANKILVRSGGQALAMDLAARADVERITANHQFQLQEPYKEKPAPEQVAAVEANIIFVNADDVWAMGYDGAGTVMAGNDTGLDETHPTIAPHYRGCLNPPTCTSWDHNYNWWDATGTYPNDPWDGHGHGTHTTGTMVGDDGGTNQIGMAPGAQTVHCKNMTDGGSGDDNTFTTCFQWDLAPWDLGGANPNPDLAPDAINNSWGYWGGGQNQFRDEIQALHAAGILVEVSAGNEGSSCGTLRSPGDYWEVMTTGSVNHANPYPGTITGFSSRGPSSLDPTPPYYFPDIMAPGESIRSSLPNNSYGSWGGTSMAGPHATALVGLMWSANPGLRGQVETTIEMIQETAAPLTGQGGSNCGGDYTDGPNHDWGFGTIDALAAVQAAMLFGGTGTLEGHTYDLDTGDPLGDVNIEATLSPTLTWQTVSVGDGFYQMTVFSGTYSVEASRFGYIPETISPVEVISGEVTVQDFYLEPAESALVYGWVTDANTGWPLYASIDIDGYPFGTIWTDPETGYYEISLPEGTTYNFTVEAWVAGYLPLSADVGPVMGDMEASFALEVDLDACNAPGYTPLYSYLEDFEIDDGGYTHSGDFDEWEWGTPTAWPNRCASGDLCWGTDLDGNYENNANNELLSPEIDLSGASAPLIAKWWQAWHIESASYDHVYAEVSINGGPWTEMWSHTGGTVQVDWTQMSYDISAAAGGTAQFRWRMTTDSSVVYSGYYLDLVSISTGCDPAAGGLVVGYVYDLNTSDPMDGADVWNDAGEATLTSDGGFYTLFSPTGNHDFWATADGYGTDTANLDIVDGTTTQQDFWLGAGYLEFTPSPLDATVEMGASTVVNASLANIGTADANFEFLELDRGFMPTLISIPPFTGEISPDAAPPSTARAPTAPQPTGETVGPMSFPLAGEPAFALDVYPGLNLVHIPDTTVPGYWDIIASVPQFHPAGDFLGGDFTTMYALDYDTNEFVTIDTATGTRTVIGTTSPNGNWGGMTGAVDGTLYAVSSVCGTASYLYTVDPGSGALTLVGEITNGPCIIDIAINAAGEMYGVEIVNDVLVQIDPATGAGTVIGSVGVGANYAQGMDFEEDTGVLYWAAYTTQGELRIIDTGSGMSTLVGAFPGGNETDCLAFETGGGGGDVPWLSEDPISGTVPWDDNVGVDVTFDAGVPEITQPGEYYATLRINNDTIYGPLQVPVTMTVTAPDTWGKLTGVVGGLGYCDDDYYPIDNAAVRVEDGAPVTVTTDADGIYIIWLEEGTYTVTASAEDHTNTSAVVTITGQQTTTEDLDLRSIQPCMSVTPDSMSVVVPPGDTWSEMLTLVNDGAGPSEFSIRETTRTLGLNWAAFTSQVAGQVHSTQEDKEAVLEDVGTGLLPSGSGGPDPFGYTYMDSDEPGGPYFEWIEISGTGQNLGLTDDSHYFPINLPFTFNFYGTDFDQIAVGSNGTLYFEDAYLGFTNECLPGDGGYGVWNFLAGYWDDLNPSVGGAVYYEALTYQGQDLVVVEWYQVPHYGTSDPITYEIILFPNGSILMQYLDSSTENGGEGTVGIQGYDIDPSYYLEYSCNTAALSDNLAICYAYPGTAPNCSPEDVPWLSEEPAEGMVDADSSFDVEITFTALPTLPLGIYTATLIVNTEDADNPEFHVPVQMEITGCVEVADVDLTVVTTGTIYPDDLVEFEADIMPDNAQKPYSYTIDYDDGMMDEGSSSDDPLAFSHAYTETGTYTVEVAAWNCDMTEPIIDVVEVVVEPTPCTEVETMTLTVLTPDPIYMGGLVDFQVDIVPDDFAPPFSYTIDYGDGTVDEGSSSDDPMAFSHTFVETGTLRVEIQIRNCGMEVPVSDWVDVVVMETPSPLRHYVYLPIVVKDSE